MTNVNIDSNSKNQSHPLVADVYYQNDDPTVIITDTPRTNLPTLPPQYLKTTDCVSIYVYDANNTTARRRLQPTSSKHYDQLARVLPWPTIVYYAPVCQLTNGNIDCNPNKQNRPPLVDVYNQNANPTVVITNTPRIRNLPLTPTLPPQYPKTTDCVTNYVRYRTGHLEFIIYDMPTMPLLGGDLGITC